MSPLSLALLATSASPLAARATHNSTNGPFDDGCTLSTCNLENSIYSYRPSLAANGTFIAFFALAFLVHAGVGASKRTWGFMAAMLFGCAGEVAGYAGRVLMWQNPFEFNYFLAQIICLTFAPAFFSAAIYLTLSKVILYLDPSVARFKPKFFYWIFIPCDIISLVLQAAGGAISSTTTGNGQNGVDLALAGLIFQVVTLVVFCALAADYAVAYARSRRGALSSDGKFTASFKTFVAFLTLAILLILVRCVFRIDELSHGYDGPLEKEQGLFIGLEGVMIVLATYALVVAHPGFHLPSRDASSAAARKLEMSEASD